MKDVPDPEIPVISVVDLGVIRDVGWQGDVLIVGVSPTYSGCPATQVISRSIVEALQTQGVDAVDVQTRLSPPWTTDWISASGIEKLAAYGIAPPSPSGQPVRFDALQGAVAVPELHGTFRLFQVHLRRVWRVFIL